MSSLEKVIGDKDDKIKTLQRQLSELEREKQTETVKLRLEVDSFT